MRILKLGSRGPSVQLLQLALNRADFGPLITDGIFGHLTENALIRFQRANSLVPDGIVGSVTHRALLPLYTGYIIHTVKKGDSFFSVAKAHGSSVEAISTANPGLMADNLQIGTQLVVPLSFPVVPTDISFCSQLVGYCVRGLAARYPFIVTGEIGKSVMGRPIWSMMLGQGRNRVLYNASHHANEWITTPILLKFAEDLAFAFVSGQELYGISAGEILNYSTICLIPAVNPDGIDLVTGELQKGEYYDTALAISANYPQFSFPSGWKANIRGVDLNLQYPAGWQQAKEIKYSQGIISPAPGDFVGRSPLSAPESRAMYDFTLAFDPALTLSYHTQGQVIYWRYLDYNPYNAEKIGQILSRISGYTLENTPYASGFAGYKDWFIQDFDRPGYTIEAGLGVNPLPIEKFSTIYEDNRGILATAALLT